MTSSGSPVISPKVTIAIPTLNRVEYLRLALRSALGQTYDNLEVVVSNNASTDETASFLTGCLDPRLRVLQQAETLSMTENWNACLNAATGEYFLLLSDDDLLEPDAIRQLVGGYSHEEGQPAPGVVYCGGVIIDAAGEVTRSFRRSPEKEEAHSLILEFFEGRRDLWFCGVLLRTADVRPGFPPTYKVACDAAVWMRSVMRHGYAVFVPGQLVRYRLHASLSSATRQEIWRGEYKQLQQLVLAKERQAGKPDPVFCKRLGRVLQTIDRSHVLASIHASFGGNKLRLLLEYGRQLPAFLTPSGLVHMGRELARVLLGQRIFGWLWKVRNRPAQPA